MLLVAKNFKYYTYLSAITGMIVLNLIVKIYNGKVYKNVIVAIALGNTYE